MFQRIMVPVALDHVDGMERALTVAAEQARRDGARITFVTVTDKVPNAVARTPEKFAAELDMFAREQGSRHEVETDSMALFTSDPAAEMESKLLAAVEELDADLVVMSSHPPGVADALHLIGSHAAKLLRKVDISVFVVR